MLTTYRVNKHIRRSRFKKEQAITRLWSICLERNRSSPIKKNTNSARETTETSMDGGSILVLVSGFVSCKKASRQAPSLKRSRMRGLVSCLRPTTKSIYDWFNKHQELAREIKKGMPTSKRFKARELERHN